MRALFVVTTTLWVGLLVWLGSASELNAGVMFRFDTPENTGGSNWIIDLRAFKTATSAPEKINGASVMLKVVGLDVNLVGVGNGANTAWSKPDSDFVFFSSSPTEASALLIGPAQEYDGKSIFRFKFTSSSTPTADAFTLENNSSFSMDKPFLSPAFFFQEGTDWGFATLGRPSVGSTPAVPEPCSIAAWSAACAVLVLRRKRR